MLQAYSLNVAAAADAAIPFENVTLKKCCDIQLSGTLTTQLNKCGVYKVHVDGSAAASTTIQLKKDGVLQPQAQSTGTSLGFDTFVQVPHNNSCCPCSSPTTIQVCNVGTAETTFTNINITVEKIA